MLPVTLQLSDSTDALRPLMHNFWPLRSTGNAHVQRDDPVLTNGGSSWMFVLDGPVRFIDKLRAVRSKGRGLAAVTAHYEYHDQADIAHDFNKLFGAAPSIFLRSSGGLMARLRQLVRCADLVVPPEPVAIAAAVYSASLPPLDSAATAVHSDKSFNREMSYRGNNEAARVCSANF